MNNESRHQCLIYDGPPSDKLQLLAAIIKEKMAEGYRCLYLNSAPMVAGMRSTLSALGIDVTEEESTKRLILSADPVSDGWEFNCDEMIAQLESTLDQALEDGYKGLWASGDMTWEFGPKKDFSKLLEYELKLEEFFSKRKEMYGICQYHKESLPEETMRQSIHVHSSIIISETLTLINPHYLKLSSPADINTSQKIDKMIASLCQF